MTAWWSQANGALAAIGNDLTDVGAAANAYTWTALGSACRQLTTDVEKTQREPAPLATVNTPLQAALTDYARAGVECNSAVTTTTLSLIAHASADIQSGNTEIQQATADVKAFVPGA